MPIALGTVPWHFLLKEQIGCKCTVFISKIIQNVYACSIFAGIFTPWAKENLNIWEKKTFSHFQPFDSTVSYSKFWKCSIGINGLNFSLEEDDCREGREPQGVPPFTVVQSNTTCSLFDGSRCIRSCCLIRRFNHPSTSTGIASLETLKSPITDADFKHPWKKIFLCPWGREFQMAKAAQRNQRSCGFCFNQFLKRQPEHPHLKRVLSTCRAPLAEPRL